MNVWEFLGKCFIAIVILGAGAFLWDKGERTRAKQLKNSTMPFYTINGEDLFLVSKNTQEEKNV